MDLRTVMSKEWIKRWNRPNSLQQAQYYSWSTTKILQELLGTQIPSQLYFFKDNNTDIYFIKEEWEAFLEHCKNVCLNNKDFLNNITRKGLDILSDLEKYTKSVYNSDLTTLSKQELLKTYKDFRHKLWYEFGVAWINVLIEDLVFEKLNKILEKKSKNIAKDSDIICSLTQPTHIQQEQIDLLKIAVSKDDKEEKLKQHTKKYAYLPLYDVHIKPFGIEYFRKRMQKEKNPAKELKELQESFEQNKVQFNELIKRLNLTNQELDLVKYVNGFIFLKDYRSHFRSIYSLHLKKLFDEIARREKIPVNDLFLMTEKETQELIEHDKKPDLQNRRKPFIYLKYHDNEWVLEGEQVKEFEQSLGKAELGEEVKGIPASKGLAKGKAKIIKNPDEIRKVKKGDVLITSMTRPDYVPAMERAGAIVTDEGGVLCHAAIISREMGKPCVIGTKNATDVFKDNDFVEVDANKGIVRKISK